jgi:hypothetical protein
MVGEGGFICYDEKYWNTVMYSSGTTGVARTLLAAFEVSGDKYRLFSEAESNMVEEPFTEGSEHGLGTGRRKGGVLISPQFAKMVAVKVRDVHSVAKERRKAREERRLAPSSGGPKNHAKGMGTAGGKGAGDEEP